MAVIKRGRKSVTDKVQTALEAKNRKDMFSALTEKLGDVTTIKETVAKITETTGVTATPIAVRKMLRKGIKSGFVRKGSALHSVASITRGRPKGYSPPKAEVETEVETEVVDEPVA